MRRSNTVLAAICLLLGACAAPPEEALEPSEALAASVPPEAAPEPSGPLAALAAPRPPETNPFGLNVHTVPFDSMQWDRIAWLGVGWVRADLPWMLASRGPGVYEWSRLDGTVMGALERGIEVLGLISGTPAWVFGVDSGAAWAGNMVPPADGPWADFVQEAVRRYRPGGVLARQQGWPEGVGIHHWEVWNEPDLRTFWLGTAAEYRDRIWLPAVRILRREDPTARIVSGGLCCFEPRRNDPWKQGGSTAEVFASMESRDAMDVFSVHYYPRSAEQTALEDPYREMEDWLRGAQSFLDRLYGGRRTVPIWLTETGFPLDVFGEEQQNLGIQRLVGRMLLSNTNRLIRPESGFYLLEKFFLFNSISSSYGALGLDPVFRPTRSGLGYRTSIFRAFDVLDRRR